VSATLVQIPNWGNILLDAGEGTWGQLVRQFGIDESLRGNIWEVLRDLKCIFISHIHGDHHMGIAQILRKRRLVRLRFPF
jgi:ribonuclease Z